MAEFVKKVKASNFSVREVSKLNELVAKYSSILFNKKTDSGTNQQKIEVWNQIAIEFNCNMPGPTPRSASQLKFKFGNLKRVAKTEWSNVVQEQRKTGGGPPPSDVSETTLWLKGIMHTSMVGETTTSDCDGYTGMLSYPTTTAAMELVEVDQAAAVPLSCELEEQEKPQEDVICAEKPIIKRKMASPLVTGSKKKSAVTPAILRKNLSSMTKRKIEYFDESQDFMKRKEAREVELHQLHLRKALAECLAAEAQQELAELLLKKKKKKNSC